jgi:hypothetical protein
MWRTSSSGGWATVTWLFWTQSAATPKDLVTASIYQEGMGWMKRPEQEWLCKKSFGLAPKEYMRKDMVAVDCLESGLKKDQRRKETL